MSKKFFLAWISSVFLAIANGLLQELRQGRHFTEFRAPQVSMAVILALFTLSSGAYHVSCALRVAIEPVRFQFLPASS